MEVQTTTGESVIIDATDWPLYAQHRWVTTASGHVCTRLNGKVQYLHRLIINAGPNQEVDHINGNPADNRRSNLRIATHRQNLANQRKQANCSSRFKGVIRIAQYNKWRAQIKVNKKCIFLGNFVIEEDAARAYDRAAQQHFGEFARLNFPEEGTR